MMRRLPSGHGWKRAWRRRLRRLALASFVASSLAVIGLAVPMVVHGQADALLSYGATASGWSIQPYAVNDAYLNLPADQAAPYVYVNIDNSPEAQAKAAYFFPGNAVNGVLASEVGQQGVHYQVPSGIVAQYPSEGNTSSTASSQTAAINDGQTTQIGAGSQSAQAMEAYARASASLASYQFAPPPGVIPTSTQPPALPTVPVSPPVLPTIALPSTVSTATPSVPSPLPTATSGSGGGGTAPAPTPTPTPVPPTPTPCLILICPTPIGESGTNGHIVAAPMASSGVQLPDLFEQHLVSALRAAELAHPGLLTLAHGKTPTLDPNLPFASADATTYAVAQASDNGVTSAVQTSAQHVELLQGLITFSSVESTLQGLAPATLTLGSGTITTKVVGATIAGIPVTIDAQGIQINCQGSTQAPCTGNGSGAAIQTLTDALNQALKAAGLKLVLNQNVMVSHIGMWQGTGGGVDLSGTLTPPSTSLLLPTQLDISLGRVTANLYALPAPPLQNGGGGSGSTSYPATYIPPSFTYYPGSPGFSNTSTSGGGGSGRHGQSGPLFGTLSQPEMLMLLMVVQGLSMAAVAGTASNASAAAKAAQTIVEEETT